MRDVCEGRTQSSLHRHCHPRRRLSCVHGRHARPFNARRCLRHQRVEHKRGRHHAKPGGRETRVSHGAVFAQPVRAALTISVVSCPAVGSRFELRGTRPPTPPLPRAPPLPTRRPPTRSPAPPNRARPVRRKVHDGASEHAGARFAPVERVRRSAANPARARTWCRPAQRLRKVYARRHERAPQTLPDHGPEYTSVGTRHERRLGTRLHSTLTAHLTKTDQGALAEVDRRRAQVRNTKTLSPAPLRDCTGLSRLHNTVATTCGARHAALAPPVFASLGRRCSDVRAAVVVAGGVLPGRRHNRYREDRLAVAAAAVTHGVGSSTEPPQHLHIPRRLALHDVHSRRVRRAFGVSCYEVGAWRERRLNKP